MRWVKAERGDWRTDGLRCINQCMITLNYQLTYGTIFTTSIQHLLVQSNVTEHARRRNHQWLAHFYIQVSFTNCTPSNQKQNIMLTYKKQHHHYCLCVWCCQSCCKSQNAEQLLLQQYLSNHFGLDVEKWPCMCAAKVWQKMTLPHSRIF